MFKVTAWILGVVGACAVFLGLFILFAGEDQYVGNLGFAWRVGDVAAAWAYGLLAGGVLLLALVAVLVVRGRRQRVHR